MDAEMTKPILQTLRDHGVDVRLGENVVKIEKTDHGLRLILGSGGSLETSMLMVGIGVKPEVSLAESAGLRIGKSGGIWVDEHMRTSDRDIFAVGDAIEISHVVLGEQSIVPLAGPANRQGRIAADNALGGDSRYRGTQGTAIVGVLGKTAAMTGASEKALVRAGRAFRKVYIHPTDHAGYYPGAESMTLKMLFDPATGEILGGEGVGGAGVDKRIDILAVAIQAEMTVFDLEEMELCYSPQYGSAKDPINMLGFVAAGMIRGQHPQTDMEGFLSSDGSTDYILDVRTQEEFDRGHLPGATNISVDELRSNLDRLPKDQRIAAYCQVGQRGYLATRILNQSGFDAVNMGGGYKTYQLLAD